MENSLMQNWERHLLKMQDRRVREERMRMRIRKLLGSRTTKEEELVELDTQVAHGLCGAEFDSTVQRISSKCDELLVLHRELLVIQKDIDNTLNEIRNNGGTRADQEFWRRAKNQISRTKHELVMPSSYDANDA